MQIRGYSAMIHGKGYAINTTQRNYQLPIGIIFMQSYPIGIATSIHSSKILEGRSPSRLYRYRSEAEIAQRQIFSRFEKSYTLFASAASKWCESERASFEERSDEKVRSVERSENTFLFRDRFPVVRNFKELPRNYLIHIFAISS
jgi:hypothetical protein